MNREGRRLHERSRRTKQTIRRYRAASTIRSFWSGCFERLRDAVGWMTGRISRCGCDTNVGLICRRADEDTCPCACHLINDETRSQVNGSESSS